MLRSHLPHLASRMQRNANQTVSLTAREIARDAKATVARDTGETAAGIEAEDVAPGHSRVTAPFPAGLIEFGTRRMGARPFMVPAAERARSTIVAAMGRRLFR